VPPAVLVGDRLVAGHQVDDAEPRVAESDAPVFGDPLPLAVGAAVVQAGGRSCQRLAGDAGMGVIDGYYAAHCRSSRRVESEWSGGNMSRRRSCNILPGAEIRQPGHG